MAKTERGFTEDLDEIARGVRRLEEIEDPERREAVRLALELRADQTSPDQARRARMRRRVLATVGQVRRPTFADRLAGVLTVLAFPAPYALRVFAAVVLIGGALGGITVASADSLPGDALYDVKLAAEDLRLALATSAEDRATVEISIAEHRLSEAERLAEAGREDDAIIVTSSYGTHLANAAAELAQIDASVPSTGALVAQLQRRLDAQQARVAVTADRLAGDPRHTTTAAVLAAVATTANPTASEVPAARIADNAAAVAARVAEVAQRRVGAPASPSARTEAPGARPTNPAPRAGIPTATATATGTGATASGAPVSSSAPAPARTPPGATATPTPSSRVTAAPTPNASARAAAEAARKAAEAAKQAAERAKQGASKTPTPPGRPTPAPTRR